MDSWKSIRKLAPMTPIVDGISSIERMIPRSSNAGLAFGYCDFQPGTIDMEVGNPEAFILLAGSLIARCGDDVVELETGNALWMPEGTSLKISAHDAARVIYIIREDD